MEIEITDTGSNCIVNLSKEKLVAMLLERNQLLHDMAQLKTNLFTICGKLELLNDDNSFKEKPSMTRLVPKIMGYVSDMDKVKRDFGFVADLLPMISRYQNLTIEPA